MTPSPFFIWSRTAVLLVLRRGSRMAMA